MKINNPLKKQSKIKLEERISNYYNNLENEDFNKLYCDINYHNIKFNDNITRLAMRRPNGTLYFLDVIYNN